MNPFLPTYSYSAPRQYVIDDQYASAAAQGRAARQHYAAAQRVQAARDAQRARQAQMQCDRAYSRPYSPYVDPEEYGDLDQDDYYGGYLSNVDPREPAYLEALKERKRFEAQRHLQQQREMDEARRQQELLARQCEQEEERRRLVFEEQERRRSRQGQRMPDDGEDLQQLYLGLPYSRRRQAPKSQSFIPSENIMPSYTPEEAAATEKIQSLWRARATRKRALSSLESIQSRFVALSSEFVPPSTLDFIVDDKPTPVSTQGIPLPLTSTDAEDEMAETVMPKLAFTPSNLPLRAYDEALVRLLAQLDAIESGGDQTVRDKRRALARQIEAEASRLERWKVAVWNAKRGCGAGYADVRTAQWPWPFPVRFLPTRTASGVQPMGPR